MSKGGQISGQLQSSCWLAKRSVEGQHEIHGRSAQRDHERDAGRACGSHDGDRAYAG